MKICTDNVEIGNGSFFAVDEACGSLARTWREQTNELPESEVDIKESDNGKRVSAKEGRELQVLM